jgi:hypothetical protein
VLITFFFGSLQGLVLDYTPTKPELIVAATTIVATPFNSFAHGFGLH